MQKGLPVTGSPFPKHEIFADTKVAARFMSEESMMPRYCPVMSQAYPLNDQAETKAEPNNNQAGTKAKPKPPLLLPSNRLLPPLPRPFNIIPYPGLRACAYGGTAGRLFHGLPRYPAPLGYLIQRQSAPLYEPGKF